MKQLLEDYKRRLETATKLYNSSLDDISRLRIKTKIGCYNTIITELEREIEAEKEKELTKSELREIVYSLNYSYIETTAKLTSADLGDIERGYLEESKTKLRNLITKVENILYY